MNRSILEKMNGQRVAQVFVTAWPPFGASVENADMSIGLVLDSDLDNMYSISTNADDRWTPAIRKIVKPTLFHSWNSFYFRMSNWSYTDDITGLDWEVYDATCAKEFEYISFNIIRSFSLLYKDDINNPFGVKIVFDSDYIVSLPAATGSSFFTKYFNLVKNDLDFKEENMQ